MYLKSIKINGFKSFADKIDLELSKQITGIVGPNGSGKSNIVDAIKWVLGEQSLKALRGSEAMSDVIFNGSKSRGQSTRASVALTFDNSDKYLNSEFSEIEVKRVVYQNGDNEYYLNNSKVRLKDITDLFIDAGASSKSFNIISQGNITDVVNQKSEDRRIIFESAAGVLKYKKRKEDTLKKLAKTNDNLEKVSLLINELELQLTPLKEQRDIASKYLEYSSSLKSKEIGLLAYELRNLSIEEKKLKEEQEVVKEELDNINLTNSTDISKLENLKLNKLKQDEVLSKYQEELLTLTKEIASLESQKQLAVERKKYEVDDIKLQNNIMLLKEEELNLNKNITSITSSIEDIQNKLSNITKEKQDLEDKILKLTHKHYTLEGLINDKNKEILETKNRIDIINNNLSENLSMPYAVKQVLNNPRFNIYGTISTLIDVEDRFVSAINIALGANSNVLVVDDEVVAKEAIEYLKTNHLGRATFFPLNVIKSRYIDQNTLNEVKSCKGFIDVASNLVKYDVKYKGIIENQLGNIIIVDNIDNMNIIGKLIGYKYRIVTLQGDVLYVGGAITGGSIKDNQNVLLLKEQLSKLNKSLEALEKEVKEYAKEFSELLKDEKTNNETLHSIQEEIFNNNEVLNRKNIMLNDLKREYNAKHQELISTDNLVNNKIDDELNSILDSFYKKSSDKDILEEKIKDIKNNIDNLNDEIEQLEKSNRDINSKVNEKQNKLKDIEIRLGKIDVKMDNYLLNLNENYQMTYEHALDISDLEIDEGIVKTEVSKLKSLIKDLGEVNIGSIKEYERVSTRYEFLSNQKNDIELSINELLNIINDMDEIMITKFKDTYEAVSNKFSEVFKTLFKGGTGRLELTDPNDLLETGIDIIAIPPGKKLKSIALLSGGEKTLTALSLLFAILEVKPVPFIVLDEVEAALDGANVTTFGKYLESKKDKSQFIIITHKNKTMEYADTLYGITMQESGVSKLVSVKLED